MKPRWMLVTLMALVTLGEGPAIPEEKPPLLVTASVSTAGPYGELWELTVTPEGNASLRVHYMLKPFGTMLAQFTLPDEVMDGIRRAVNEQHFLDLPAELAPQVSPLHMPHLQVSVSIGSKQHKVSLYHPAPIEEQATVQRFLAVWRAAFAGLPVKPSW